jgi:hypothetical protein
MSDGQGGADDPIGEIIRLAAEKDSDDAEIFARLEALGATLDVDEVFAILVPYDTPDVLG